MAVVLSASRSSELYIPRPCQHGRVRVEREPSSRLRGEEKEEETAAARCSHIFLTRARVSKASPSLPRTQFGYRRRVKGDSADRHQVPQGSDVTPRERVGLSPPPLGTLREACVPRQQ